MDATGAHSAARPSGLFSLLHLNIYMKKRYLVEQTLASAQSALTDIQNGNKPDIFSLMKWNDSMLRHVFYRIGQHQYGQYFENVVAELYPMEFSLLTNQTRAKTILAEYIEELQEQAAAMTDLDTPIIYEPPFEENGYYPQSV